MALTDLDERRREGRRRLRAQRLRAGFLRRRVVVASVLCFGLLWGTILFQMATGNDPVLSSKTPATATAPTTKRERSPAAAATEAVETTDPRESEDGLDEREPEDDAGAVPAPESEAEAVEAEPAEAVEAPAEPEPEPELEPLTTGQS